MQLIWFLAFGCLTVCAIPQEEGYVQPNGLNFEKAPALAERIGTIYSDLIDEGNENHNNGVDGWYLPQPDGSLQWMQMEKIEKIQSSNVVPEIASRFLTTPFNEVKFWLYSAKHPNLGKDIFKTAIDIDMSGFNPEHPTYFVAHGFLQTKYSFSLNMLLRSALFELGPANFIYVEWADAKTFNYVRSSSRVPVVGELLAKLFDTLVHHYNMDCEKTHLIGHSLGAHVVGFAAKNIKSCKVPKITALDPALPLFPHDKPEDRLNSTDALYVESIHTDGGFYGHDKPIGTASFYCNGGSKQPGCGLVLYNVCCHERSVHYFREAILKNNFQTSKCDDYRNAIENKCSDQYSDVRMADQNNHLVARGIYYVETNGRPPYGN